MSNHRDEVTELLEALAERGVDLEVGSYNRSHKVVPAGRCFFSASSDAFRADSWAEVAAYLAGIVEGLDISERRASPVTFEGRVWYVVLPDGDTFDTVHGAELIQVPETITPESVADLRVNACVRLPACSALVDLFTKRGRR